MRLVLLLPCGASALLGMDAGLLLLGLPAPIASDRLAQVHGMVMVIGFVGALIALERAVARAAWWAYAAPLGMALGALLALSPAPLGVGRIAMVVGTLMLLVNYRALWRRSYDPAVAIQALGAALAVGAVVLWSGGAAVAQVTAWLTGFLVLTIAGERVELARVTQLGAEPARGERHDAEAMAIALGLVIAVVVQALWPGVGGPLVGLALLALAARFAWRDVARHTIRATGLPRFSAACLLAGYAWLAVAGLLWFADPARGLVHDARLHATFLGFVMSMVLGHAPIILPAVLRRPLPCTPAFWVVFAALHGSLLVRVVADLSGAEVVRQVGGVLNVLALLALVATALTTSLSAGSRKAR